jgi:hypothetical protein
MADTAHTPGLEPYPQALYDAVMVAVEGWILGRMQVLVGSSELAVQGESARDTKSAVKGESAVNTEFADLIRNAAHSVAELVRTDLLELLSTDVDEQRMNPLHVLRACVAPATSALHTLGVPKAARDQYEESAMPDDVYALGPLTWRDLGEDVHDAGINWGAYKAAVVLSRRRAEGKIA